MAVRHKIKQGNFYQVLCTSVLFVLTSKDRGYAQIIAVMIVYHHGSMHQVSTTRNHVIYSRELITRVVALQRSARYDTRLIKVSKV